MKQGKGARIGCGSAVLGCEVVEGSSEMETSGQTTEGCISGNKFGYQVGESANGRKSRCKVMR